MFDKLLDKATSPLLLEPDWKTILQLCDTIKTLQVTPKYAIHSIKKKFRHENAHVILHSLQCLESIVKNSGRSIHKEVAQKDIIEALKELVKAGPDQIRNKVLELIQYWSYGLGKQYQIFRDTYYFLKHENYHFPPLKECEAMFENDDILPEWKDDKACFRCRQIFTTFIRKHHCRACGESFCDKCSSKSYPLPKFGIDHDVRVCESCYEKLTARIPLISKPTPPSIKAANPKKIQAEMNEEECFQLALAISHSEADEKERQKKLLTQKYAISASTNTSEDNNEYAEVKKDIEQGEKDSFISDNEIDQFTILVIEHINNFKYRMLSNQQRNRNITIDTAVQSVFLMLQHLHPELHHFMQLLEDKRGYYENLQDKLSQLKDAREALNALRTDYYERKQQEALEYERQRQIQLAQKLDLMRQKKQEYLEYQRQVHLQHLAQQELEMQNRLEHQRQLTFAREQHSQQSLYTSVMTYPRNSNEGNNYSNPVEQVSLINSTVLYTEQSQSVPLINQSKPVPQLIIFD